MDKDPLKIEGKIEEPCDICKKGGKFNQPFQPGTPGIREEILKGLILLMAVRENQ